MKLFNLKIGAQKLPIFKQLLLLVFFLVFFFLSPAQPHTGAKFNQTARGQCPSASLEWGALCHVSCDRYRVFAGSGGLLGGWAGPKLGGKWLVII